MEPVTCITDSAQHRPVDGFSPEAQ